MSRLFPAYLLQVLLLLTLPLQGQDTQICPANPSWNIHAQIIHPALITESKIGRNATFRVQADLLPGFQLDGFTLENIVLLPKIRMEFRSYFNLDERAAKQKYTGLYSGFYNFSCLDFGFETKKVLPWQAIGLGLGYHRYFELSDAYIDFGLALMGKHVNSKYSSYYYISESYEMYLAIQVGIGMVLGRRD